MVRFSTIFYSYEEKHRSKTTKKILKHIILYVHCVYLLIWSLTQLDFPFYDFSVIYLIFQNVLASLDSSRDLQPICAKSFVNRLHLLLQISKILS